MNKQELAPRQQMNEEVKFGLLSSNRKGVVLPVPTHTAMAKMWRLYDKVPTHTVTRIKPENTVIRDRRQSPETTHTMIPWNDSNAQTQLRQKEGLRWERWITGQDHLLFLQSTWVWFPEPAWWLMTTCNYNSRDLMHYSDLRGLLHTYNMYI